MTPSKVFKIVNTSALIPWLLMIFAPNWSFTHLLLDNYIFPLVFAVIYAFYIFTTFGKSEGSFMSLEGVAKLFNNPKTLLAGWIHYLVFDLFVGTWMFQDAPIHGIPHWLLSICLFFTLMLGPIGFLMYWCLKHFVFIT
jgi:hypothetical protein